MSLQAQLAALLTEMERRNPASTLQPLMAGLFDRQRALLLDKSTRKAALCSRRAGKSHTAAVACIRALLDPVEADSAYIGITRGAAKKILFSLLRRLNDKYDLHLHFNLADLTVEHENGNTLYITGAHNEDDTEKLRGLKLKLAILDECASFKSHMAYLVDEVLEPTLIDCNGTMMQIGTPSANPIGNYFHNVTTGGDKGYAIHRWTLLDNPHIPHARTWLDNYRERKGWGLDHPIYRREWLGEWTISDDQMVYKYKAENQHYALLPRGIQFHHVIGVDLGFNDAFALTVLAYSEDARNVWLVKEVIREGLIPAKMAEIIQNMKAIYNPVAIVADHGGLGKAICEEFNQRYHLNILPAEKSKKLAYIELLNGDLLSGMVKIRSDSVVAREMQALQWDADRPGKEDERMPNDGVDSLLYAWRQCRHYLGLDREAMPEPGTPEAINYAAKQAETEEAEAMASGIQEPWYIDP